MDETEIADAAPYEARAGDLLREARESRKLERRDIAQETRIPLRHLEALEDSDYARLPAPTYSIGFAKTYAREVGLDAEMIASMLRGELASSGSGVPERDYFQATDPARVPPRSLAWIALVVAIVLGLAYGLWRSGVFGEGADDRARLAAGTDAPAGELSPVDQPPPPPSETAPPPATGPVVLTATDVVWLRIYDMESDEVIHETEMQPGDHYEIPATAQNPAIRVGRAESLRVTVGGRAVPPLGPPSTTLSDISLRPADLVNRPPSAAAPPPDAGADAPRPAFTP